MPIALALTLCLLYKEGLQFIYSSSESPSLEYPPLFPPETELRLLLLLLLMLWLPQLLLLGMVGLERCAEVRADEAEPVAPTLEFLVLKGATELCLQMKKNIGFEKISVKTIFWHCISPLH